jgi:hypothetical protein
MPPGGRRARSRLHRVLGDHAAHRARLCRWVCTTLLSGCGFWSKCQTARLRLCWERLRWLRWRSWVMCLPAAGAGPGYGDAPGRHHASRLEAGLDSGSDELHGLRIDGSMAMLRRRSMRSLRLGQVVPQAVQRLTAVSATARDAS